MTRLVQIQQDVGLRTAATASAYPGWPCRKGCDDCCRSLASLPRITHDEWTFIAGALNALPAAIAESARRRIRESRSASRPVTCPLLDIAAGACLVYDARPVACRAYGFYSEREAVLGCGRIESIAAERPDVIWGNHAALEDRLQSLGPARPLHEWLS